LIVNQAPMAETGVVSAVGSCVRSVRPDNFHDLSLFKGLQAGKFPPAFAGERRGGSTRRLWSLLAHAARRVEIVTATSEDGNTDCVIPKQKSTKKSTWA
jgi:hypothetical protein